MNHKLVDEWEAEAASPETYRLESAARPVTCFRLFHLTGGPCPDNHFVLLFRVGNEDWRKTRDDNWSLGQIAARLAASRPR